MNHPAFRLLFFLFVGFSMLDVFRTHANQKEATEADKEEFQEFDEPDPAFKYSSQAQTDTFEDDSVEIRPPTGVGSSNAFKTPMDMPKVQILFCVSCGYRQAFDQFSQVLREKYPGVEIEGGNYPPGTLKSIVAQVISFAKIGIIVAVVMGKDPFQAIGLATPAVFTWMINNKVSSCLMLFMLSNSIEGMLMSSGAFEIYLGKNLVWSKMESGRVPSPAELFQAIDGQLGLKESNMAFNDGFAQAT